MDNEFSFNNNDKQILNFWKVNDIFEKSLEINKKYPLWTFLDGPPFVNGTPHSGHVLVSYVKDTVIRYKSMNGFYIPRTIGFDCHGLPLEQEAEKKIGIKNPEEIKKYGIKNYNNVCRDIINECTNKWEDCFFKMGRWVNFKDQYKTMDLNFMETEWWVFNNLFKKGLIYRGFKVMPYSYACTTALSNFEASSNYKQVIDQSAIVMFPILDDDRFHNCSFLAWTTTPWTLPSNLALCVNPEMIYLKVWDKNKEHFFIIAEDLINNVYKINKKNKIEDNYVIEDRFPGINLKGIKYEPLFHYFKNELYFHVIVDSFVTNENGTGIVHIAPGFGADDFRVCIDNNIVTKKGERLVCPVDESGCFTDKVINYSKRCAKDCDKDIIKDIKNQSKLFSQEPYRHNYPHCWRTDKPLIYKCIDTWFINVELIKNDLIENNKKTNWMPNHIKEARFHKWLEDAKDWCVSRSRYWGTPIPLWISDDGEEIVCIESIEELKNETGIFDITDLHKENIDHLVIPSREGRGYLKKIPDVFDCWYESGLCGLARYHYPFENKEYCENNYPVDFISESLDQTRGWFYTLMVLSTALFNKPAFKNVIVTGLIKASDGKKMSKRLKNYTDPLELIDTYGSDPMRLYLISSPVVKAEEFSFQDKGVQLLTRKLLPWYNGFKFFNQCLKSYKSKNINYNDKILDSSSTNLMDLWIKEKTNSLLKDVIKNMDEFKLYKINNLIMDFIDQLTNWYIKLNRDRLKGLIDDKNTKESLATLNQVLWKFNTIMAPFTPFFSEYIYQNLNRNKEIISVHHLQYPKPDVSVNLDIERQMSRVQQVIDLTRKLKTSLDISLSFPVKKVTICHSNKEWQKDIEYLKEYIISENTIIELEIKDINQFVDFVIQPNLGNIGKKFRKESGKVSKIIKEATLDNINDLVYKDHKLSDEYYKITPEIKNSISNNYLLEDDILILIDTSVDEQVETLDQVYQFKRQIQNIRKDAGLEISDKIKIYYSSKTDLNNIISCNLDVLKTMIAYDILPMNLLNLKSEIIAHNNFQINDKSIEVLLVKD